MPGQGSGRYPSSRNWRPSADAFKSIALELKEKVEKLERIIKNQNLEMKFMMEEIAFQRYHLKKHHNRKEPFICKVCGYNSEWSKRSD